MRQLLHTTVYSRWVTAIMLFWMFNISAQPQDNMIITVAPDTSYQTMQGFGAALAYYEGWLTAHPKKAEIYEAIFGELSLDILRLRNAYEYDPGMIDRAKEFVEAAQSSLGKPIDVLVSSWGPPGTLKSNGDRKNGGTLRYTIEEGTVQFDYAGFADWWNRSMDEYNANGIYPTYISLQNEPDFTATWESCRFDPSEKITTTDTIAGYNKALRAVHDSLNTRSIVPKILGPETVGIGYNAVENYVNALDINLLDGIAHHLYHGVNANNPYASTDFKKVGALHPEVPHFQTEYSLGDWWSLAGLIYKSLYDENVAAYIYWELIWDGDGLVSLDNPWNSSQWQDPQKGYTKTKDFYVFKQYSAFIHPGWQRVASGGSTDTHKTLTFISPDRDSATTVIINTSSSEQLNAAIAFRDYSVTESQVYRTSDEMNCALIQNMPVTAVNCPPASITTVTMTLNEDPSRIPVETISFSQSDTIINTRQGTLELQPQVLPEDATNSALFWELLSGSDIATVTSSGTLHALGTGDGKVMVKALATDGSAITATVEITLINQVLVEEIKLFASAGIINIPQGTIQFSTQVLPEEAFNKTVSWELTSGSEIATIDQDGLLQALGNENGTVEVKVSATDGSGMFKNQSISIINQEITIRDWKGDNFWVGSDRGTIRVSMAPSPARGVLRIYNLSGMLQGSYDVPAFSGGLILNERVRPGIYMVEFSNRHTRMVQQIVIME